MTHTSMYRMKGLAEVAEFLRQLGPEIAGKLTTWLRDVLEPDETMPDVALLFELVERKSEQARERLREKDQRLSRVLTALDAARRVRDRAGEKLRGVLINARGLLDGCTRESVAHTRFRGRISQRWHRAWAQALAFLTCLRDSGFRPEALPGLLPYPKADLDAALALSLDEIERASQAVQRAEHQVKGARIRLKKGQVETARIHRRTLQLVEALASLAEAPELLERRPVSLREEAAQKNRRRRKKKVTPAKSPESSPTTVLQPDASPESAPTTILQPDASLKFGPTSVLQPDTSLKFGPTTILQANSSPKSGPTTVLQTDTAPDFGPTTVLQMQERRSGEKHWPAQAARGATTGTPATDTPDTLRRTEEAQSAEAPNAAGVRRNRDSFRLHVASLRGNRRRLGSVRGGDRARLWLLASAGGDDRRIGGPERAENGEFEAARPWKAKIFALFGR